MQIQKSLVQNRVNVQPAIFLRPEIDKINTAKLKDIVKRHLGVIVEKASEATHVVYPHPNARDEGPPALHLSFCLLAYLFIVYSSLNLAFSHSNRLLLLLLTYPFHSVSNSLSKSNSNFVTSLVFTV